MRFAGLLLT